MEEDAGRGPVKRHLDPIGRERPQEIIRRVAMARHLNPACPHLAHRMRVGANPHAPPEALGQRSGGPLGFRRLKSTVPDFDDVHVRGEGLGVAPPRTLPGGVRVRKVDHAPLGPDALDHIEHGCAPGDGLRQIEPDDVDPLGGLHLFTGDDGLRIASRHGERYPQAVVVGDGNALHPPGPRLFEDGFRVRKAVPGPPGMQMEVEAEHPRRRGIAVGRARTREGPSPTLGSGFTLPQHGRPPPAGCPEGCPPHSGRRQASPRSGAHGAPGGPPRPEGPGWREGPRRRPKRARAPR